jgi:hypothetical protein
MKGQSPRLSPINHSVREKYFVTMNICLIVFLFICGAPRQTDKLNRGRGYHFFSTHVVIEDKMAEYCRNHDYVCRYR